METVIKNIPVILSVKDVADFLNIATGTVYNMIYEKEVHAYKEEGSLEWNITKEELLKYLEANSTFNI